VGDPRGESLLYILFTPVEFAHIVSLTIIRRLLHSLLSYRHSLASTQLCLKYTMFYSKLLSLGLVASTEALGPRGGKDISSRGLLTGLLGGTGGVSNNIRNKGLLNKLPVVGPVLDRIDVPGRPKWPGEGNSATSPEYPYLFAAPLPIPEIAQPIFTETVNGVPIDYYEMTIESFDTQLFPDRGPTTLTG